MDRKALFLAQSDTTVGFLSQDSKKITKVKKRDLKKNFLITVDSLESLKEFVRVPKKFKKAVRGADKTTFIYSSTKAFRVVRDEFHLNFLKKLKWSFSSSANLTGQKYDEEFAKSSCGIVVEDSRGLYEGRSSKLYKIGRKKIVRLR